jgi:hypothetical protein
MKLRIGSLFPEPGYSFNVSFKVDKLIEKLLNESIMQNLLLGNSKSKNECVLSFHVSTRESVKTAEAKGPDHNKRTNWITWALNLPYKEIEEAEDYELKYCSYFFEAALQVFNHYKVENAERIINRIKHEVEVEIKSNPEYRKRS